MIEPALTTVQWTMIVVMALIFAGLVIGFYTRAGSGIEQHPMDEESTPSQPGAGAPSEVSGKDEGEPPARRGSR